MRTDPKHGFQFVIARMDVPVDVSENPYFLRQAAERAHDRFPEADYLEIFFNGGLIARIGL